MIFLSLLFYKGSVFLYKNAEDRGVVPQGYNASFIRHTASFIASQFYCALHSVIRFASSVANKITLNPQDSIALLSGDNNITLP